MAVKSNPLFVDSTKMTGDSIGTQFELGKILIYDEDSLHVCVTLPGGEVTEMKMTLNAEGNFQAKVWLRHQKSFSYQFVIERDGKRILQSVARQARAQYAILDQWEPVLAEPNALPAKSMESLQTPHASIPDHVKSVASLMEKFGF